VPKAEKWKIVPSLTLGTLAHFKLYTFSGTNI
jgi:hypothetical protein